MTPLVADVLVVIAGAVVFTIAYSLARLIHWATS